MKVFQWQARHLDYSNKQAFDLSKVIDSLKIDFFDLVKILNYCIDNKIKVKAITQVHEFGLNNYYIQMDLDIIQNKELIEYFNIQLD